jgi:hypothetical protein
MAVVEEGVIVGKRTRIWAFAHDATSVREIIVVPEDQSNILPGFKMPLGSSARRNSRITRI